MLKHASFLSGKVQPPIGSWPESLWRSVHHSAPGDPSLGSTSASPKRSQPGASLCPLGARRHPSPESLSPPRMTGPRCSQESSSPNRRAPGCSTSPLGSVTRRSASSCCAAASPSCGKIFQGSWSRGVAIRKAKPKFPKALLVRSSAFPPNPSSQVSSEGCRPSNPKSASFECSSRQSPSFSQPS